MAGGFLAGVACGVLVAGGALVAASLLADDLPGDAPPRGVQLSVEPPSAAPPEADAGGARATERAVPLVPGGD